MPPLTWEHPRRNRIESRKIMRSVGTLMEITVLLLGFVLRKIPVNQWVAGSNPAGRPNTKRYQGCEPEYPPLWEQPLKQGGFMVIDSTIHRRSGR